MLRSFICEHCGKKFEKQWYPSRKKHKYCSNECKHADNNKVVQCAYCGKEFTIYNSRTRKYCCKECDIADKRVKDKECLFCGKRYKPTRPTYVGYCSIQCSANARKATRLHKTCEWCGNEFIVRKGYTNARFCSVICSANGIATRGPDSPNWKGGCDGNRGENWERQASKARKRDNYTCQRCGLYQKRPRLPVHHIIRFHDFDDYRKANQLNNLITLCPSCHAAVENADRPRNELGQLGQWPT